MFIRHGTTSAATADNTITSTDSSKEFIDLFLKDCQHKLNVKIEHKNRFMFTLIIFYKKHRNIAWTGTSTDRPVLKNLDV